MEDKLKIDISASNESELTNSIQQFNNNLDKMTKAINSEPLNQDSNINKIPQPKKINEPTSTKENEKQKFFKKINNYLQSSIESGENSSSIQIPINNNKIFKDKRNSPNKNIDPSTDLLCQKLQQKIDLLNYENYTLNKKNKDLLSQIKDLQLELNKISHIKETELQVAEDELTDCQNKLKKKEKEFNELKEQLKINNTSENFKKKYYDIKSENDQLSANNKKLNETITTMQESLNNYKNKFNDINAEYEILKKERGMVLQQNTFNKENNKNLELENIKLQKEILQIRDEKSKLVNKIQKNEIIKKSENDEIISKMKDELESKQKKDIDKIKDNLSKINDDKIKFLKEENSELKSRIKKLESKDNEYKNLAIKQTEDTKNQMNQLNDEIAYLRIQVQLKDNDNKRANKLYNENMELINTLNIENSSLKEKVKLYQDKLSEVSTNNYAEVTGMKEALNELNVKKQAFEEQDTELDKILTEALLNDDIQDKETKNIASTLNELPNGNKKRVNQCILLTSRLKTIIDENNRLNMKLQNIELENKKYKEESALYQDIANNNKEPFEYLLKEIEKKDSELVYCKEVANDREIRFKEVMKENEVLKERIMMVEKDLRQLLENREKIDKLDYLVGKIAEDQQKLFGAQGKNMQIVDKYGRAAISKNVKVNVKAKNGGKNKSQKKNFK